MSANLQNPIFTDDTKAREWLERRVWPQGPICPHCGGKKRIGKLNGKSYRPGMYKCYVCRKPFTVKIGTIFEDSHIPMTVGYRPYS